MDIDNTKVPPHATQEEVSALRVGVGAQINQLEMMLLASVNCPSSTNLVQMRRELVELMLLKKPPFPPHTINEPWPEPHRPMSSNNTSKQPTGFSESKAKMPTTGPSSEQPTVSSMANQLADLDETRKSKEGLSKTAPATSSKLDPLETSGTSTKMPATRGLKGPATKTDSETKIVGTESKAKEGSSGLLTSHAPTGTTKSTKPSSNFKDGSNKGQKAGSSGSEMDVDSPVLLEAGEGGRRTVPTKPKGKIPKRKQGGSSESVEVSPRSGRPGRRVRIKTPAFVDDSEDDPNDIKVQPNPKAKQLATQPTSKTTKPNRTLASKPAQAQTKQQRRPFTAQIEDCTQNDNPCQNCQDRGMQCLHVPENSKACFYCAKSKIRCEMDGPVPKTKLPTANSTKSKAGSKPSKPKTKATGSGKLIKGKLVLHLEQDKSDEDGSEQYTSTGEHQVRKGDKSSDSSPGNVCLPRDGTIYDFDGHPILAWATSVLAGLPKASNSSQPTPELVTPVNDNDIGVSHAKALLDLKELLVELQGRVGNVEGTTVALVGEVPRFGKLEKRMNVLETTGKKQTDMIKGLERKVEDGLLHIPDIFNSLEELKSQPRRNLSANDNWVGHLIETAQHQTDSAAAVQRSTQLIEKSLQDLLQVFTTRISVLASPGSSTPLPSRTIPGLATAVPLAVAPQDVQPLIIPVQSNDSMPNTLHQVSNPSFSQVLGFDNGLNFNHGINFPDSLNFPQAISTATDIKFDEYLVHHQLPIQKTGIQAYQQLQSSISSTTFPSLGPGRGGKGGKAPRSWVQGNSLLDHGVSGGSA
ncbi:hypothetical protein FA15DRAFT_661095 [Coprinopsis marcescibilis]|uniref:Zn(2)-C6 fungal-type domain-containing protein n=1 Tax=Coprinopsis marcescibilis TaxID=230819 RepID=A0A5C3KE28_COPMA|nr:hypothetical protein FA15DRAFT_661095 [Coprinopsis marcescibilis]